MNRTLNIFTVALSTLLLSNCSQFEKDLYGPKKSSLAEYLAVEGTFGGDFNPNLGYLTVYDHPTLQVKGYSSMYPAKLYEFTLISNDSATGINCVAPDENHPDNIEIVTKDGATDKTSAKLSFRRLSTDMYFRWENAIHNRAELFEFSEMDFTTTNAVGTETKTSLQSAIIVEEEEGEPVELAQGTVEIHFSNIDPDNKIIEGEIAIRNPSSDEDDAIFEDSNAESNPTTFNGSIAGSFAVKYCADMNGIVNPNGE